MLRISKISVIKDPIQNLPYDTETYYNAWTVKEKDLKRIQNEQLDGVYKVFKPILIVSTLIGLTPIYNFLARNGRPVEFRWFSWQSMYSFTLLILLCLGAFLLVRNYLIAAASITDVRELVLKMGVPLFYVSASLSLLLSINFTRHLPAILKQWDERSSELCKYLQVKNKGELHFPVWKGIWFAMIVLVIPGILERTIHDVRLSFSEQCANTTNFLQCHDVVKELGKVFVKNFGANPVGSFTAYLINTVANNAWNFNDLLIAMLCLALNANFKVINNFLNEATINSHDEIDWKTIRKDHFEMCKLVKIVDQNISSMVLQSFGFNIYGLCYQVYMGIRPSIKSTMLSLYAFISFAHLTARICAVSIAGGLMYNQIRAPLKYLYRCPSSSCNNEVFRFINQICGSEIGLTGLRFFTINQQLLLAIASLIFTYELILLD